MLRGQLEEQRKRIEAEARETARRVRLSRRGDGSDVPHQRIVVVGPCASGKSMLADALRQRGYNAHAAAQEHSYVPAMWRMTKPSHLIYLDVTLENIKRRRQVSWGQDYLDDENQRLAHARQHADMVIDTDKLSAEAVIQQVLTFLQANNI